MTLAPSRVRPAPRHYLLDDMAMEARETVHDPAAVWLRDARKADPERFRDVARRNPVLSLYQISVRRAREVPFDGGLIQDEATEDRTVSPVELQKHRQWLEVTFMEEVAA
jgi:hypothetical protein